MSYEELIGKFKLEGKQHFWIFTDQRLRKISNK